MNAKELFDVEKGKGVHAEIIELNLYGKKLAMKGFEIEHYSES